MIPVFFSLQRVFIACLVLLLVAVLTSTPALAEPDAAAHYLAGLPVPEDSAYQSLTDEYWQAYKQAFNTAWEALDHDRFQPMREWQKEVLASKIDPSLPLFYPFGGPDMVHALMLYPHGREYLLFGLEPPGSLELDPDAPAQQRHELLNAVRWALRDIYQRGYFITGRMSSDLTRTELDGVLPLLLVFIARSGYEVLAIEDVELVPEGRIEIMTTKNAPKTDQTGDPGQEDGLTQAGCPDIPGVRVRFRANAYDGESEKPDGESEKSDRSPEKQVTYLQLDVSDNGLGNCTALEDYIEGIGPTNTFVKSASYLMHYATFSGIRALTLAVSDSIFQDDTGIPYRELDQADWDIILFGRYTNPIRDFSGVYQSDLNQAYLAKTHPIDTLPFSMGYHWWTSEQNHLLARRRATP
ncbi:hypothetical protein [Thiorhodovibrio frisius]|uniref:Uncharacterized protein n=1 Tax=Thiorhodovibrio frisius TaxID=631362 RepID=H8Z8S1_9GAMM|nr:hypothetical protein [Thiorhodovibrio frisius]EIC19476.1 hypothetical protein Thi970DRAFT_05001 [Thiorhodovibrio frisius]WPL22217.1 hypothetical protein Thiofri_02377 [Thiorhodovibrio frisius]